MLARKIFRLLVRSQVSEMSQHKNNTHNMSTRNYFCCVPKCRSWSRKNPELSFHKFPREGKETVFIETEHGTQLVDHRKAWIWKLNLGKPASKFMRVCSLHFTATDYLYIDGESGRSRVLKPTAVPSEKLPGNSTSVSSPTPMVPSNVKYMVKIRRLEFKNYLPPERSQQELIAAEALVQLVGNNKSENKTELMDKVFQSTFKTSISL